MRHVAILVLLSLCSFAKAETAQVKYHGPVSLDAFACTNVSEGSDVNRICYDAAERYMLIQLKTTYYHYCSIDAATVRLPDPSGPDQVPQIGPHFERMLSSGGAQG